MRSSLPQHLLKPPMAGNVRSGRGSRSIPHPLPNAPGKNYPPLPLTNTDSIESARHMEWHWRCLWLGVDWEKDDGNRKNAVETGEN